jgi:alkylhydroperoxidase family enzyme
MTSRIDVLNPGEADEERVDELLREAEKGWYGDSAFFGAMARQPELLERIVDTFQAFPLSEAVDAELLELMRLKVAECHQCAYCATVRTEEVREDVEPKEAAVFGEVDEAALSEREVLAVRLAERLSEDPHRMTDEFFRDLLETFGEDTVVELLLFTALEVGLDRFCIALNLDTTDRSRYPTGLEYPIDESELRGD